MKYETTTRDLPVKLTIEELEDVAKDTSQNIIALRAAEEEKKADAAKHKEVIDTFRKEMDRLALMTDTGEETREVVCEWTLNPKNRKVELFRTDTGAFVDSRDARNEDYQENLI